MFQILGNQNAIQFIFVTGGTHFSSSHSRGKNVEIDDRHPGEVADVDEHSRGDQYQQEKGDLSSRSLQGQYFSFRKANSG